MTTGESSARPRRRRAERHKVYKTPRHIYDIVSAASARDPKEIADDYVRTLAPKLKVDPAAIRFDKVNRSILGSHVLYQQYHQGMPISRAWLRIDIDGEGRVFQVTNDLVPEAFLETGEARIDGGEADRRALAAVEGEGRRVVERELLHYPVAGTPRLCWKVIVKSERPAGSWKIYVDAESGAIVERFDLICRADGKGRIFDPNPVIALGDTTLKSDAVIPAGAYRDVVLLELDGTGFLDGKFVSTRLTKNRANAAGHDFTCQRDQRTFREVMAYFHIDRVRRHLADLGFADVMNRAIAIDADGFADDRSQFDPVERSITFGTGPVPDAEDAEIIVHEYGHAIQDDQVPGFGESNEARAMGEGFGDFLAASFFADRKPAALQPTIANWDTTPFLRRLDSPKRYPKGIIDEPHDDGEIWSACLWQLRAALGQLPAERLIIAHHHLLTRNASFADAVNAQITTDKQLNGGKNVALITKVFTDRGILKKPKAKPKPKNTAAGTAGAPA